MADGRWEKREKSLSRQEISCNDLSSLSNTFVRAWRSVAMEKSEMCFLPNSSTLLQDNVKRKIIEVPVSMQIF